MLLLCLDSHISSGTIFALATLSVVYADLIPSAVVTYDLSIPVLESSDNTHLTSLRSKSYSGESLDI